MLLTKIDVQKILYQLIAGICCILCVIVLVIIEEVPNERILITFLLWPSIIMLFKSKSMENMYNTKILKKIDEYCFDVFIWHGLVIKFIYVLIKTTGINFVKSYAVMIATVIIAFCIGCISHKFISVPINKLINKIQKKSE